LGLAARSKFNAQQSAKLFGGYYRRDFEVSVG